LDEEGNVMAARAISGHPLLKDSAVAAATGWKFKPTTLSGVPVKVIGTITFNFTLGVTPKDFEALEKEVEKDPSSADARYALGSAYYGAGRYQDAIKQLLEAIHIKPEIAEAHRKLGFAYDALQRYNEAAGSFKEAIRLDPNDPEALVGLGVADAMLYLYQDAIANFKRALELAPKVADTHFFLAMTYSAMGRLDDAVASFKEGLAIRPSDAEWHYRLGQTYARLGNKRAAMEEYTLLKKLDPRLAEELLKEIESAPGGNRTKAASR
jgi:tetratricopeptide (TPR) repeat protein